MQFLKLSVKQRNILHQAFRQALYFLLVLAFIVFQWKLASIYQGTTYTEHGIIENIQLGLLIVCGLSFVWQARPKTPDRPLVLFFASLCFLGAVRELDSFFEQVLPVISWKWGYLFPIGACLHWWHHKQKTWDSFFHFIDSSVFYMMCMAVLIGLVLAQAYGHRSFITNVLGPDINAMAVRRLVEEGIESVGYFILLLSSVEYWFVFHPSKQRIKK